MSDTVLIALIVNFLGVIGLSIKTIRDIVVTKRRSGNNPGYPCKTHTEKLKELDNKLDKVVSEQSRQGESMKRLDRIEGMLNGSFRK